MFLIKLPPDGSKILCTLKAVDGQAEVAVADNGEGIDPEHMKHVFDRFFGADHSHRRFGQQGTGLGLTIAKAVIEAHGGAITLKSTLGQGPIARVLLAMRLRGVSQ